MTSEADTNSSVPVISVVVCTYNPRRDYFDRTIEGIKRQQDAPDHEIIIIDNNSDPAVASWLQDDGSNLRIVEEPEPGLTQARIRALTEVRSELIVFVDDDNVLEERYLATVYELSKKFPLLGVYGAARIIPEFETEPEPRNARYMYALALRNLDRDHWGNDPTHTNSNPFGAGFCVRKQVLASFAELATSEDGLSNLGRRGNMLLSGEDIALAWVANKLGFGTGNFLDLGLDHLISSDRVERGYLKRILEGHNYSSTFLHFYFGGECKPWNRWRVCRLCSLAQEKRNSEFGHYPGLPTGQT